MGRLDKDVSQFLLRVGGREGRGNGSYIGV